MKRQVIIITMAVGALSFGCKKTNQSGIGEDTIALTTNQLVEKYGEQEKVRMEKSVKQMAALWENKDGTKEEFTQYCLDNFIADEAVRQKVFERLCRQFEGIFGGFNKMNVSLREPVDVVDFEEFPIDEAFGAWSPSAHFEEDFFDNKIAFYVMLNFPFYTLEEKNSLGEQWSDLEWGYARMGDIFISRIPADLAQKISDVTLFADNYIANYNIYMGYLVDNQKNKLFPEDMKLITHWNLRDELKTQYADVTPQGLTKQQMIYEVMKHIIYQTIPTEVINKNDFIWNPYQNKLFTKNGTEEKATPEPSTRYEHLLNTFKALKAIDNYTPMYPTYISRKFDQEFELSQAEVEELFIKMVSSEQVKQVGELIAERLGRNLQPFDIWYDGFKSRSSIDPAVLDNMTQTKYPNKDAFVKDLPIIMTKLGFTSEKADYVCSYVTVDASRGPGHAWESAMKDDKARLRTRIGENGIDYKGYNIGTHEFGHNVEQTITLHDIPNYMMRGVPNTAFTEALAFVFQKRDLDLLGYVNNDPDAKQLTTLDIFWGCYEIMGVSLVDMRVWKWLYENPNATKEQLKDKVIEIAKEVWNTYYYPVFGTKDEPILAIYSHMISSPLYLSAYPLGHLVEFQLENYFEGKTLGLEVPRLFANGRLTPQRWMKKGLNAELSVDAILEATTEAVKKIK
ncbi:MAG: hypothetical protein FWH36_03480 [Lentimicrobiaceae bacterium]|nr:hypothetical protein [Lentimicrobiaceae bacterium]